MTLWHIVVFALWLSGVQYAFAEPPQPKKPPVKTKEFQIVNVSATARFLDQGAIAYEESIIDITTKAFQSMIQLHGGLPRDLIGRPYRKFAMDFDTSKLHGEADPEWIEMGIKSGLFNDFISFENRLIHEIFHLWNGETYRYKKRLEHWFSEGCSEYYAIKIAIRTGAIDREEGVRRMLVPLASYLSAKGLGSKSMREVCATMESKRDHYFLIYHGGYVVSMVLDFDIRMETNNEKSLDDLMRWLYADFRRERGKLYDINDLKDGLQKLTGKDYTKFFARYVEGTEILLVGQYFTRNEIRNLRIKNGKEIDPLRAKALSAIFELPFHNVIRE